MANPPVPTEPGRVGNVPSDKPGVFVGNVGEGTTAASAGIKPGDRITRINGHPVTTPSDVNTVLSDVRLGQTVTIGLIRGDRELTVEAVYK
jgi:S1-C subfamily serine protease